MDTFKIVATMEKRGVYFTLVPHRWEQDKQLFWPGHLTHKKRELLRADPTSQPNFDISWATYKCIVKLHDIKDFKEGLKLEKQFIDCSDTESEELLFVNTKSDIIQNRNYMFDESETNKASLIPQLIDENFANPDIILANKIEQKCEDLKKDMIQMKDELKTHFIKITTYLDRIDKKIDNISSHTSSTDNTHQECNEEVFNFPVSSEEEMEILEQRIRSDENYKSKLIEYLSKIGGTTGQEDGTKIGYKIVDHVFSAQLLTHYSWTGISRGQKYEKKCFQNVQGILNVFFQVIFLADNRHTVQKNINMFKDGILKHAKKRSFRKRSLKQIIDAIDKTVSDKGALDIESAEIILEESEETNTQ